MALELKAEEKSIINLFSGDKNQYIIPPYQRPYSWKKDQCIELFEDLKKAFEDEDTNGYFLGNIVIASSQEDKNRLEVIDGQQRLTTLTLLLKALLFFDNKNTKLKNAIWELNDRTGEKEAQRLETRVFQDKDAFFLKEALELKFSNDDTCKIKKNDNQFKINICYFYTQLKKFDEKTLFDFADFLLYDVSILPIETSANSKTMSRKNAIKIFETLNNRGISLSASDILKAKIFAIALNNRTSDKFIKNWNSLYEKCQKISYSIDDIFKVYKLIIEVEKNVEIENKSLLDTFLKKDFSPFFDKTDEEIMNDLFKIVDCIIFNNAVTINPTIYGELTKWLQILNQFKKMNITILSLFKCNLEDYEKIIFKLKNIIRYLLIEDTRIDFDTRKNIINGITNTNKKNIDINRMQNIKILSFLNFYLNPNQKAIYPFYIIDYSDDAEYFKSYIFNDFYYFLDHEPFSYIYIINDFKSTGKHNKKQLINELKKSKIKDNNILAKKLELDKEEFQKFLKEKEKIEIERMNNFLRDYNAN